MPNLVIVESPAKAKTINKILGRDYVVRASMGHVRDLPESELGSSVPTFRYTRRSISDSSSRLGPTFHRYRVSLFHHPGPAGNV